MSNDEDSLQGYIVPSVIIRGGKSVADDEALVILYNFLKKQEGRFLSSQRNSLFLGAVLLAFGIALISLSSLMFLISGVILLVAGGLLEYLFLTRSPKSIKEVQKFYYPFAICTVETNDYGKSKSLAIDLGGALWSQNFTTDVPDKDRIDSLSQSFPGSASSLSDVPNSLSLLSKLNTSFGQKVTSWPIDSSDWFNKLKDIVSRTTRRPENLFGNSDYNSAKRIAYNLSKELDRLKFDKGYLLSIKASLTPKVQSLQEQLQTILSKETEYSSRAVARFVEDISPNATMFDSLLETFTDDIRDNLLTIERSAERDMESLEYQIQSERREIQRISGTREQAFRSEISRIQNLVKLTQAQVLSLYGVQKQVEQAMANMSEALRVASEEMRKLRVKLKQSDMNASNFGTERRDILYLNGLMQSSPDASQGFTSSEGSRVTSTMSSASLAIDSASARKQIAEGEARHYGTIPARLQSDMGVAQDQIRILKQALGEFIDPLQKLVFQTSEELQSLLAEGRARAEAAVSARNEDLQVVRRNVLRIDSSRQFVISMIDGAQALLPKEVEKHIRPMEDRISALSSAKTRTFSIIDHVIANCDECIKKIEGSFLNSVQEGVYYLPFWQIKSQAIGNAEQITTYGISEFKEENSILYPMFAQLTLPPDWAIELSQSGLKLIIDSKTKESLSATNGRKHSLRISSIDRYLCMRELKKLNAK